jgi:hypothetical protein
MDILEYARSKIRGALDTLDDTAALDFPFQHAREALLELSKTFKSIQQTLDTLGPSNNQDIVKTYCQRALEALTLQLPTIGFIARSTEVSGPVEFHGPFLRLSRQALGSNARLIISSEWEISPNTLIVPELFHNHQFVLVGLPVSESDNALITPLAGHELGHNIWESEKYEDTYVEPIYREIIRLLHDDRVWSKFHIEYNLNDKSQIEGDMFGIMIWENTVAWALAQAQELFCDFIGLLLFRESYLYAFAYLVAPWGFGRSEPRYPAMESRISAMVKAAEAYGIQIPEGYSGHFSASAQGGDEDLLLAVTDEAVQAILPQLIELAKSFISQKNLLPNTNDVDRITGDFKSGVPATNAPGICSILIAGWKLRCSSDNPWGDEYPLAESKSWASTLNELLLKSFEVFEIEQRQQKDTSCLTVQQSLDY